MANIKQENFGKLSDGREAKIFTQTLFIGQKFLFIV